MMKFSSCLVAIVLIFTFISIVDCKFKVVDLSHLQNSQSIKWPTLDNYNFTHKFRGMYNNQFWLEHNVFFMTEHMGTHIDAPSHFGKGSWRVQQIPIEHLIGPGVIINVQKKAEADPDYRVSIDDVIEYETKYGRIPDGAIVIMNSGWYHKYPDKTKIFNTEHHTDISKFHFPGFHEDTVQWLIDKRFIHAVGSDSPSFDYGQAKIFPVHQIISKNNVIGIENVAHLDRIPESGSTVFLPVIKIDDGSGGPTRVLATFDDGQDPPSSAARSIHIEQILFALLLATV